MVNDVLLNKSAALERCLGRIREEYLGSEDEFTTNYTKQDAVILNLERACQICIDMGFHIIKLKKWGLPQHYREVFEVLEKQGVLTKETDK